MVILAFLSPVSARRCPLASGFLVSLADFVPLGQGPGHQRSVPLSPGGQLSFHSEPALLLGSSFVSSLLLSFEGWHLCTFLFPFSPCADMFRDSSETTLSSSLWSLLMSPLSSLFHAGVFQSDFLPPKAGSPMV